MMYASYFAHLYRYDHKGITLYGYDTAFSLFHFVTKFLADEDRIATISE